MTFVCCHENRKKAILADKTKNGIDYLEVLDGDTLSSAIRQRVLFVVCLNPIAPAPTVQNVIVAGGESITNVKVLAVCVASAYAGAPGMPPGLDPYLALIPDKTKALLVYVDRPGDFSTYQLSLVQPSSTAPLLDPQLSSIDFSFKVECGPDFDCAPIQPDCPPPVLQTPPINYLAKDYGSFRTLMTDRLSQLLPGWSAATEADMGVALAELVSYVGDHLSYQQDAVATEAYLGTARSRVSLRRHALLVDYRISDGCNSRVWIQIDVDPAATQPVFLQRSASRFYTFAQNMPATLAVGAGNEESALLAGVQIFEPMHDAALYADLNKMLFYTWGDTDCCLPAGSTSATLKGSHPALVAGDVLIFKEVLGPRTGSASDADPRHRCAVRLTAVTPSKDPLFGNALVTEIAWAATDALPFPVCVSSSYTDPATSRTVQVDGITVVLGNVVLADYGVTMPPEALPTVPGPALSYAATGGDMCQTSTGTAVPVRYMPSPSYGPLTQAAPLATSPLAAAGIPVTAAMVRLSETPPIELVNKNGSACLALQPNSPGQWAAYFGVTLAVNGKNFDLTVVYVPSGIAAAVPVEKFTGLSIKSSDATFAPKVINAQSNLIRVPTSYKPPATAASSFPGVIYMLSTGTVSIPDPGNSSGTYLSLQTTDPTTWPDLMGITSAVNATNSAQFDLTVLYQPKTGAQGVPVPATLELMTGLELATVTDAVATGSQLITIVSFAQAPDASLSAAQMMTTDPNAAVPAIKLTGSLSGLVTSWTPMLDLLESSETDPVFVVEVESDGTASLRFGDDVNGKRPDQGTQFSTVYRVQNGSPGNVGSDCVTKMDTNAGAALKKCTNPLPASGGTDPESMDQIRRRAPWAFLTQERAVTMADYQTLADRQPGVERSVANMRWTGSWHTVFMAVEPIGGGNLADTAKADLQKEMEPYRLAGQDMEFESPEYLSLEIDLTVCVDPSYFRSSVESELMLVLSNQTLPGGKKGVFHPDNFAFGQTVFLSPVYAAARSVAGVTIVTATKFQPQGVDTNQYLDSGELKLGPLQIARLDNDRNFPNHGQLNLTMLGGK